MKHSMGENVRIVIMVALDGNRGHRCRCCGREDLQDKVGEGKRCKGTKHSLGENVGIVRLAALDCGRGRRRRCCGGEALREKEREGRDVKR